VDQRREQPHSPEQQASGEQDYCQTGRQHGEDSAVTKASRERERPEDVFLLLRSLTLPVRHNGIVLPLFKPGKAIPATRITYHSPRNPLS
jgi:hypothetical protein